MKTRQQLSYEESLQIIGSLSQVSKMPWWSWSISATQCNTGSKLAQVKGSTCEGCYALKGRYLFPNVRAAHDRRLEGTKDPRWVEAFTLVLKTLYAKTKKKRSSGETENRMRWFDSGDLQSLTMLEDINEIARRTPFIQHWLPTREVGIVSQFLEKQGAFADNLTVRLSAPLVGLLPKRRTSGLPFSTVGCDDEVSVHQCKALSEQGNRCLDCDACWKRLDINYPLH